MQNSFFTIRITIFLILLTLFSVPASAQTGNIRGSVSGPEGMPVQYANVMLLKSSDSTLVKGMITDTLGKYAFENIGRGSYLITVSFAGMEQAFTKVFEIGAGMTQADQGMINLKRVKGQLKEVTLTVKKPMFEQKIDRMVINVKNSVTNAGGTALDVLEKSPGVTVNRQNNTIAINGKNGVAVMLNGKMTYMPADALVQLLAGISAGSIDKIELITTPPAKLDAGGNAGYINVVLTNNHYSGFSGSYFLTSGYGEKEDAAAGINFNYRSTKINFYGDYSVSHDHYIQTTSGLTRFTRAGEVITNSFFSNRDATRQVYNARMELDYQIDSSNSIGALVSGYLNHWLMLAHNGATAFKNNVPDTNIIMVDDPERNLWQNIMTNLNFKHSFKPGNTILLDFNFIYYKDNNPNTYSTDYFNKANEFLYHEDQRGGKITPIKFRVASVDYTTPIGKKLSMEAGGKISLSRFTNNVNVDNLKQGIWVIDTSLSANYLLKENIGAAYTSFTLKLNPKISMTAGLRYEYTSSNLSTIAASNLVDRKYGEFFPTFYVTDKISAGSSLNFSYSRRITRPTFNDMAPFTIFFDPKTFYSGNPALQPTIANNLQASYSFKNYSVSLSYTHEVNSIENFYFQTQKIDTASGILYLSSRNFKYVKYLTLGLSLPITVTNWWSMQNNIGGNIYNGNSSNNNTPVLYHFVDCNINSTQRFSLLKDFLIEVTGYYASATYLGTEKGKPIYRLDAGLQKSFNFKKDIIRLMANDIFNSGGLYRISETLGNSGAFLSRDFNFRLVAYKLSYTHQFGNNASGGKSERPTGAEEELKRVHN